MFKIEESLLIKTPTAELHLISILDQYYKEMHMLISNIHLTHVMLEDNVGKVFPLETNKYDGSWYKNLVVSSNIILDRLHHIVDPEIKYDSVFNDGSKCDFKALGNIWNKINFIVKYNLNDSEWDVRYKKWNIAATTKKLEELIASGVKINVPLLEAIDFDVNKYVSVPKELEKEQNFEFDNLVRVLKGEPAKFEPLTVESTMENATPVQAAVQEKKTLEDVLRQPQPVEKTVEVSKKKDERGPVSPVKKEMDQLLKWISFKEEDIKAYKAKMRFGYNPDELKKIETMLASIEKELVANDELLSEAKKYIPVDPIKKDIDQLLRWTSDIESKIRKYKRQQNGAGLLDDAKEVDKLLNALQIEIDNVDSEMRTAKQFLPKDPILKEVNAILRWAELRKADIRDYKHKQQKHDDINTELKLIEKEMKIVDSKLEDINHDIIVLNKNKPVDPLKDEMDDIIKWAKKREDDVADYKNSTKTNQWVQQKPQSVGKTLNKDVQQPSVQSKPVTKIIVDRTREMLLEQQLEEAQAEIREAKEEIKHIKNRELENESRLLKEKERALAEIRKTHEKELEELKQYHEVQKVTPEENSLVAKKASNNNAVQIDNSEPKHDVVSKKPTKSFLTVRKKPIKQDEELFADPIKIVDWDDYDVDEEPIEEREPILVGAPIAREVVNNTPRKQNNPTKGLITAELEQLEKEMNSIKDKYRQVNTDYKEALQKYKTEAKILETAFEVLPSNLKKIATRQLPSMINHLLDEGYIREQAKNKSLTVKKNTQTKKTSTVKTKKSDKNKKK